MTPVTPLWLRLFHLGGGLGHPPDALFELQEWQMPFHGICKLGLLLII
jgi:hypothetical protein